MAVTQEEYDQIANEVMAQSGGQQQPQGQMPYFPPQPSINETTLVSQTNPQGLIDELGHKLRSEIKKTEEDGSTKWVRPEGIDPMLNEKGIYSILVDVYSITNQGTILSNLTEDIVSKIVTELGKTVTFKLAMNWKEYECKKSNLSTIVLIVCNMSYMSLRRGMDQGERNFIKNVGRYTEHITMGGGMQGGQQMEGGKKDRKLWNPFSWF